MKKSNIPRKTPVSRKNGLVKSKRSRIMRAISIPFDMDKRMRKYADVNWSAVATAAFVEALKALARK